MTMAAPITHFGRIDEAAFRDLVDGRAITLELASGAGNGALGDVRAHVILADIGWERMLAALYDATLAPPPRDPRGIVRPDRSDPEEDDD